MLTINRKFEYKDTYMYIAVGIVAFVSTFILLYVASIINYNEFSKTLSRMTGQATAAAEERQAEQATNSENSQSQNNSDQTNDGQVVSGKPMNQPTEPLATYQPAAATNTVTKTPQVTVSTPPTPIVAVPPVTIVTNPPAEQTQQDPPADTNSGGLLPAITQPVTNTLDAVGNLLGL